MAILQAANRTSVAVRLRWCVIRLQPNPPNIKEYCSTVD
jgi:hypothetical protein